MPDHSERYVCPRCGDKVQVWVEEIIERKSAVNPHSGRISKRSKKVSSNNTNGNSGFECTSCSWSADGGDWPAPFNELEDSLSAHVQSIEGFETGPAHPDYRR